MINIRGSGRTKAPTPKGSCLARTGPTGTDLDFGIKQRSLNPAPPSVNCPHPEPLPVAQGRLSAYHNDSKTGHSCLEFLGRKADNQGKCVVSRLSLPQPSPVLSAFRLWTWTGKDEGDRRQALIPSGIKGFAQIYNITLSTRPL